MLLNGSSCEFSLFTTTIRLVGFCSSGKLSHPTKYSLKNQMWAASAYLLKCHAQVIISESQWTAESDAVGSAFLFWLNACLDVMGCLETGCHIFHSGGNIELGFAVWAPRRYVVVLPNTTGSGGYGLATHIALQGLKDILQLLIGTLYHECASFRGIASPSAPPELDSSA